MSTTTETKQTKVLRALKVRGLTAKQIGARFGVANPTALVSRLRLEHGVNVRTFESRDSKGRMLTKYRVAHR